MITVDSRTRILDDAFPIDLIDRAAAEWPASDWPHWFRYDSPDEKKLACNDWSQIPPACRELLGRMAMMTTPWPRAIPDLTLYGAGMHGMEPGGFLGPHLDASRHKHTGLRRVGNMILFLNDMPPGATNGEFQSPDSAVRPKAGRMVFFSCHDAGAVHGMNGVLDWPAGSIRKTLALWWYDAGDDPTPRPRAHFLPHAGETETAEDVAKWRRERAGLPLGDPDPVIGEIIHDTLKFVSPVTDTLKFVTPITDTLEFGTS